MLQPLVAGKCLEIPGTAVSYQSFKNQVTVKAKEQSAAKAYQRMASKLNSINTIFFIFIFYSGKAQSLPILTTRKKYESSD
jgi:hypothetical protein